MPIDSIQYARYTYDTPYLGECEVLKYKINKYDD